jgi:hypothetical protein
VSENIIAVNVPNAISIIAMAAGGVLIWAAIKKFTGGKPSGVSTGGTFSQ